MTQVDLTILRGYEQGGWLRGKPFGDYLIWDYTQKTQAQRHWTPETRMCRGLVTTLDGLIVSRPFPKFFNLGEQPLPDGLEHSRPPLVYEKVDGSLIVVSLHEGQRIVSSRSSMNNPHTQFAESLMGDWQPREGYTYCFEVVNPEWPIVVRYRHPSLKLLARIETATGNEPPSLLDVTEWGRGGHAERYILRWPFDPEEHAKPNAEGFVLHWPEHRLRVKVKFAEYLRLHKLLTGVTTRSIWEMLRAGKPTEALYEDVPDEFHAWVREQVNALHQAYANVAGKALHQVGLVRSLPTRAEQARAIADDPYRSIIFALLDDKPVHRLIWDTVKPEQSRPFWGAQPDMTNVYVAA